MSDENGVQSSCTVITGRGSPCPLASLLLRRTTLLVDLPSLRFSGILLICPERAGIDGPGLWVWFLGYLPTTTHSVVCNEVKFLYKNITQSSFIMYTAAP